MLQVTHAVVRGVGLGGATKSNTYKLQIATDENDRYAFLDVKKVDNVISAQYMTLFVSIYLFIYSN